MLKDIPQNKYRIGKDTLDMEQRILDSNQRLSTISIGITTAPIRQSEILKQTIRRLEVFFIDCLVAKKEAIKVTLVVIIRGQYMPYIAPMIVLKWGMILDSSKNILSSPRLFP